MNNKVTRTDQHNKVNKIIGQNLRYIRKLRKVSLQKLGAEIGVTYQQIGKYEHGSNQICAFRLWQLSNSLKCPVKYFFDGTYILRMQAYHNRVFHAAITPELLDIDKLQEEMVQGHSCWRPARACKTATATWATVVETSPAIRSKSS